jgi:hypothetical protein
VSTLQSLSLLRYPVWLLQNPNGIPSFSPDI